MRRFPGIVCAGRRHRRGRCDLGVGRTGDRSRLRAVIRGLRGGGRRLRGRGGGDGIHPVFPVLGILLPVPALLPPRLRGRGL
ncbi:hypothetical protein E4J66_11665 [Actinomyces viscosus]|uniref:hypothetical protein n=1 Tax=Actinomyces viscosus TaxID=1656 RepID=UPI000F8265E7|nr:hypothetical protein [Actinomyces viscosus]TFH51520.1 hypothetical protein E4J66_11665 [Actinomyces viscosus]